MAQFEKFEIWHAQGSGAYLSEVTIVSCAMRRDAARAMMLRTRDVIDLVTSWVPDYRKHDVMFVTPALLDA